MTNDDRDDQRLELLMEELDFSGLDDMDDYEPDEEDMEEFSEFFCRRCHCELDGDNAPPDGYLCYDCLALEVEDEIDDGSHCADCGRALTDDDAPLGNLCHECECPQHCEFT